MVFYAEGPLSVRVTTDEIDSRARLLKDNTTCEFLSLHPSRTVQWEEEVEAWKARNAILCFRSKQARKQANKTPRSTVNS